MPKKKIPDTSQGLVAAYIRKSVIQWPEGCITLEQRKSHVEDLRRIRMAELESDAARDGERIDLWFDDMGVSGRGEFLDRRVDFARLRQMAAEGKVRVVYARELSRLARDFVDTEVFFGEMELYGVEIRSADLPRAARKTDSDMLRRIFAAVYQQKAEADALVIKDKLRAKVETGQWIGRFRPPWGLRYDTRHKDRLEYDPLTADKACLLFETFVAHLGIGGATAKALNRAWDAGLPRATLTPLGARWTSTTVLQMVRRAVYRRTITWSGLTIPRPDHIPEVVPAELVAEADRLLEMRAPLNAETHERMKAGRMDYTYGPMLRCASCGYQMRALTHPTSKRKDLTPPGAPWPAWISWVCNEARRLRANCPEAGSVLQFRLEALVAEGIGQALTLFRESFVPPRKSARPAKTSPDATKDTLEAALARLAAQRQRCLDMYRAEVIRDIEDLKRMVADVDAEEARLRAQVAALDAGGTDDGPLPLPPLSKAEWTRLCGRYDELYAGTDYRHFSVTRYDVPLDPAKHDLLRSLGATLHVKVLPRDPPARRRPAKEPPPEQEPPTEEGTRPAVTRQFGGRVVLMLELAALGLTGARAITVVESDEQLEAHRLWKRERLSLTHYTKRRKNKDQEGNTE